MKIDKRRLQRRYNLSQSQPPENLLHHTHSYWNDKIITLFAGNEAINSTIYKPKGLKGYLQPVDLMYIVSADLVITSSFAAGGGDTYSIKLSVDADDYEYLFSDAITYDNEVTNISKPMKNFFKKFETSNVNISVKVSNAANPVIIYGAYLRFTTYQEDTYGDYESPTNPMLITDSIVNKDYIKKLDVEAQSFEYISGIKPR
jgi:hypothetical protein